MYLIRQLAKKYNLTRSALLHYDAIGLLTPSSRTAVGYRLYSEADERKLQIILLFRSMGISLDNIKQLLGKNETRLANALLIRLQELSQEIGELKERQRNIINLLQNIKTVENFFQQEHEGRIDHTLLEGIQPVAWHEQFEAMSPHLHKEFLKILDMLPHQFKESLQASLSALPQEERTRLNAIIHKNDLSD